MCRNKKNNYKMIKIKLSSPFYHAKERHVYILFFFIHHKNLNQLYIYPKNDIMENKSQSDTLYVAAH